MVGMSGSTSERVAEATASARSFPATLPSKMAGFGTPRWAALPLDYISDATRWKGEITAPGPQPTWWVLAPANCSSCPLYPTSTLLGFDARCVEDRPPFVNFG